MTLPRLFLSYGREDDEDFVARLNRDLQRLGFETWYDREDLPTRGADFTDEIARAVAERDYVLMFVGPHAAQSEWVRREWLHALKLCIPVIPLVVIGAGTLGAVLQDFPRAIRSANALDCRERARKYDDLLNTLVKNLERPPLPLCPPTGRGLPPHYIERPQYLDAVKTQLAIGDPTVPDRTRIAGITSQQEVAALQGIGGIGKTTLAMAVCADCDVRRTFDHIFFLDVGPERGTESVVWLMQTVGRLLDANAPDYQDNLNLARGHLIAQLDKKRTLIVLDDVWEEGIVEEFSFSGVDCRLLVTTRSKALLADPTEVNRLSTAEALALMAHVLGRAADTLPAACAQIAEILEGHTLAVQIAAAWLKKYGLARAEQYARDLQSADALDYLQLSAKDKNRNVARSLELSYNALDAADQARFRALGVFAANSTFDDAALAALWGMDAADKQMLFAVGRLLDAALLTQAVPAVQSDAAAPPLYEVERGLGGEERYSLHPLLRTYARALLRRENGYDAAFDAYAAHYIAIAAQFDELPQEQWRAIEAADLPNITAVGDALYAQYKPYMTDISPPPGTPVGTAFLPSEPGADSSPLSMRNEWGGDLGVGSALTDRALRFAENTYRYLFNRRELRRMEWLEMGLAAARAAGDRTRESLFLASIGSTYSAYGDKHTAIRYLEQSLLIDRELGDQQNEAATLNNIGGAYWQLGEPRKALDYFEQALPLIRAVGDRGGEAATLNNIGGAWDALGEKRKALVYYEQALPLRRAVGDRRGEATTLNNIGFAWAALGEPRKALVYYEQALPLRRAVGDRGGEATTLNNMAAIYFDDKDYARAADTVRKIIPIVQQIGDVSSEAAFTYNLAYVLGTALGEKGEAITLVERAIALLESKGLDRDAAGQTVAQMRAFLAQLRGEGA